MSLDISDANIKDTLFKLKDHGDHLGWVLLGFVPKTDKIQVKETGTGVDALKDELGDGSILWAYLRWNSDSLPKFVYFSWCGEGVTGQRKALFMSHSQQMEAYFAKVGLTCHVTINARVEADVVEKDIGVKVAKAMGVSYDKAQGDKSRFQQSAEGAGATFKSVKKAHGLVTKGNVVVKKAVENPEYKVDEKQREQFWKEQQQQKSQAKRIGESSDYKVSEEERIKFWAQQEAVKGGAKRIGDSKDYQVSEAERAAYWAAHEKSNGPAKRIGESKDYSVSEAERAAFWEKTQQESAAAKAAPKAGPAKGSPGKVVNKFAQQQQQEPAKVPSAKAAPPAKTAPAKVAPTKAAGPSPAELAAKKRAEEEAKRRAEEEAKRRAEEEAAAAAAAAAAAEEEEAAAAEEGWEEEEQWEEGAAEEEAWEEEGAAAPEEEEAWEEEGAAEEEEGGWEEEEASYPQCQAIGDWAAANEGDLGLSVGDVIDVWDSESDPTGWWHGANSATGASGYFPSNYVKMI